LQLVPFLGHHKCLLTLLSRIDGDAPAHNTISAGRLDGSRAGLFHTLKQLVLEHPNLILRTLPFAEAKSDSQLLLVS
jgi:hypothetical protein